MGHQTSDARDASFWKSGASNSQAPQGGVREGRFDINQARRMGSDPHSPLSEARPLFVVPLTPFEQGVHAARRGLPGAFWDRGEALVRLDAGQHALAL